MNLNSALLRTSIRKLSAVPKVYSLVLLWLLTTCVTSSHAQITTADILGTVIDASHAVVVDAKIRITDEETQIVRTAATNAAGQYTVNLLPRGRYLIIIDAAGYKQFLAQHVTVAAGDRMRVDAVLQVGGAQQTVEVSTSTSALQTDSSTLDTAITEQSVQDLPLNGRNFVQLAQLAAGVNEGPSYAVSSGTQPQDRRQTASLSANGQSDSFNTELIDGTDNNERDTGTIGVRPSIDSIAEFRVETNLYRADVGRTAGAVINIITKSGANKMHGDIFEFLRNDVLNAKNYFSTTGAKPELKLNQFGGSASGPIRKDKTFFFGDYEGYRMAKGNTEILTVPTLYEEQNVGDFTDIGGAKISSAYVNSIAAKYYALYPAPNLPGKTNNYNSTYRKTQQSDTFDGRMDHIFNASNILYGRYTLNNVHTDIGSPLPVVNGIAPGGDLTAFDGTAKQYAQNGQLNYTHVFNPNLLLELKAAYTRLNNSALPLNYGINASEEFGLTGVNLNLFSSGLAPMYISGYANVGDGVDLPMQDLDNVFQYNGALTMTRGAHNIKIGGALIRRQLSHEINYRNALFEFVGFTSSPGAAMINFLEGVPYEVLRSTELVTPGWRTWEPSVYVQDDWRLTKSLTLNLGLRYDVFTPYTESHNRLSNFDVTTGKIIVAGKTADGKAGVPTDYSNLAPRVGFAQMLGHGMVLRGGFGLSFFPTNYEWSLLGAPYTSTYGPVFVGTSAYKGLSAGLPTTLTAQDPDNPSGSMYAIDRNFKNAYLYQFNLNFEKQLGNNIFSLGYVGEIGHRLGENIPNLNVPAPSTAKNIDSLRPFYATVPNLTSISYLTSHGASDYHAMQAIFERRFSKGITASTNYTYAHGINDIQATSRGTWGAYALLPKQISTYDRGNSDLDIRHRVAATVTYALPFGEAAHGLKQTAIGGWHFNAIGVWSTGLPFTVFNAVPKINTGATWDRPNRIASGKLAHPSVSEWFDVSAFTAQTAGTAGNSGRNILYGPHMRHVDASIFKDFPLSDRLRMQFRAESFNLSNTPSFEVPNSQINASNAGTLSSTLIDSRAFQFALKLVY